MFRSFFSSSFKTARVNVRLKTWHDDSYRVYIQPGLLASIPEHLKQYPFASKYVIVTDTQVRKLYGEDLLAELRAEGIDATLLSFQAGETHKRLATVEKLADQMIQLGHNRHSGILALGGGVVGDLAGFLASIFMRGIPFAHIPTTLIAMADSSIGGKTGVDSKLGKNLIGTFSQPKRIYIDPQLLSTLPKQQVQNGLAEVLKHGLLGSPTILQRLTQFPDRAQNAHPTLMTELLRHSSAFKANIVERDVKESHVRMWLNYGHSIGHAIEHASGYRLGHGQAVAIGMNLENRLAVDRGLQSPKTCETIEQQIENLGLPTSIPEKIDREPILSALAHDKKNRNCGFTMTLLKRIGKPVIVEGITDEEVRAVL